MKGISSRLLAAFSWIRSYLGRLRELSTLLWLGILPICAAISVNFLILFSSQGEELTAAFRENASFHLILLSLGSLSYTVLCSWLAMGFLSEVGDPPSSTLLPYIVAIAVLTSGMGILGIRPSSYLFLGFVILLLVCPLLSQDSRLLSYLPILRLDAVAAGVWIAALVGTGSLLLLLLILYPVSTSRSIQSVALFYIACGYWPLVGTLLLVILPRRWGLPSLVPLIVCTALVFSRSNDNHSVRMTPDVKSSIFDEDAYVDSRPFEEHVKEWVRQVCREDFRPLRGPCPVFFVAAEGGGARAAYWTFTVLAHFDKLTNGLSTKHMFAISGVSGGSLGAAVFLAEKTMQGGQEPRGMPVERMQQGQSFLEQDFLSPLIGSALFPDFVQRFLPTPITKLDRARAFEAGLDESWQSLTHNTQFSEDFRALWNATKGSPFPSLLLNSTNVETGRRFIISNLDFGPKEVADAYYAYDPSALYQIKSLPMSSALDLSARFPYFSPAGLVFSRPSKEAIGAWSGRDGPAPKEVAWGRLVDGGYFENSGASTLSDIVFLFDRSVQELHEGGFIDEKVHPEPIVLFISNNPRLERFRFPSDDPPSPPKVPLEPDLFGVFPDRNGNLRGLSHKLTWATSVPLEEIWSPVETFLATRDARASFEKFSLTNRLIEYRLHESESCGRKTFYRPHAGTQEVSLGFLLEERKLEPGSYRRAELWSAEPGLGWFLSKSSRDTMNGLIDSLEEPVGLETNLQAALRCYYDPPFVAKFDKNNFDFGDTHLGGSPIELTLQLTNLDELPLDWLEFNFAEPETSGQFQISNSCSSPLAFNQSCNVTLTYTPAKEGSFTGTLYASSPIYGLLDEVAIKANASNH